MVIRALVLCLGWSVLCGRLGCEVLVAHAAEGADDLAPGVYLDPETRIYVDILDPQTEVISWVGINAVEVVEPDGGVYGPYSPPATHVPVQGLVGSYEVRLLDDVAEDDWSIDVPGATGRIWSPMWSFRDLVGVEWNQSLYVKVDVGDGLNGGVVELRYQGFYPYSFDMLANAEGLPGFSGRSAPGHVVGEVLGSHSIYVNPPESATYTWTSPVVSGAAVTAGQSQCDLVAPGQQSAVFSFETNVEGLAHVVCDLDADGIFDWASDDDLHLIEAVEAGGVTVAWDGLDNTGEPVSPGLYDCRVTVAIGEMHLLSYDVQQCYPGLRLFRLDASHQPQSLAMFWNDAEVQANAVELGGDVGAGKGLEASGPSGLASGDPAQDFEANVNARAWGSVFTGSPGKGDEAWLDTYTYLDLDDSAVLTVEVVDSDLDTDGDGLVDWDEICNQDTFVDVADSDSDGLSDGDEVSLGTDPMMSDSDGDCLSDYDELYIWSSDPLVDGDLDGDDLSDGQEVCVHGTNPASPDSDGDCITDGQEALNQTNPLDPIGTDTDGDGLTNEEEGCIYGTDASLFDTDGDGLSDSVELLAGMNPLDVDSDGDGASDGLEVVIGTDPLLGDSDGDGLSDGQEVHGDPFSDPLKPDSDDDGLLDPLELKLGTDPMLADTDEDGLSDYDELVTGGPGTDPTERDTDGDGLVDGHEVMFGTDPLSTDTDGDQLEDGQEVQLGTDPLSVDTDQDQLPDGIEVEAGTDPLNEDTDGDSLLDGEEVLVWGTNPLLADSDQGGMNDAEELALGRDPTDPTDDFSEGKYIGGVGCSKTGLSPTSSGLWVVGGLLLCGRRRLRAARSKRA